MDRFTQTHEPTLRLAAFLHLHMRRGIARAQVVQGGMTAWHARGWPVELDRSTKPPKP